MKTLRLAEQNLSSTARALIPFEARQQLTSLVGEQANVILEEIALALEEKKPLPVPPLKSTKTDPGDDSFYGTLGMRDKNYRPDDALAYDTIDQMLRNGQVYFALSLKQAYIRSVLRNDRSWSVNCNEKRMQEIVRGVMSRVFRRHAQEMLSCIPYGSAFFEKEWDYLTAEFWGLEGLRGKFYGYRSLKSLHPKSVDYIAYKDDGHVFNGFWQNRNKIGTGKVHVSPELALIVTYEKRWRNLWGNPAFDVIYPAWFWYEIALRSFLRYLERSGTPVAVCYAPAKGRTTAPDGTVYENMKYAQIVAGYAAKSNAIAMPSDVDEETGQALWRLEYLADDKRGDQFIRALGLLSTLIARGMVLADRAATQETEVGSYAASRVHMEATQMHNEKVLDELLAQINDYVVAPIVAYNGTQRTPPAIIETEGLDPQEKERLFKLLSTMGNQQGSDAMKMVDWRAIMDVQNIPTLTEEQIEDAYEEELERTEKRNKMMSESGAKGFGGPLPKKGQGPEQEAREQTVKQSSDWIEYQIASGAMVPVLMSAEQAAQIAERFSPRAEHFFFEAGFDSQVDRIVAEIMSELEDEDIDAATREKVRQYVLSLLGLAEEGKTLEFIDFDAIELSKIGDWLRKVYKKAKEIVNRVVKKVTGKSIGEWRKGAEKSKKYEPRAPGAPPVITRDGKEWRERDHPRDPQGRFTEKAKGKKPIKGKKVVREAKGIESVLSGDKWPGADPDKGIKAKFTFEGHEYTVVGDVTVEEMTRIHETNRVVSQKAQSLYEGFQPIPITVLDRNDPETTALYFKETTGVSGRVAWEAITKMGGFVAMGFKGQIYTDNGLADRPEIMEGLIYHEALHVQKRINQPGELGPPKYADEVFTTLLSMEYDEKHGYFPINGYPRWVSRAVQAAQNLGWSKQKLYDFAEKAHKIEGAEYNEMLDIFHKKGDVVMEDWYASDIKFGGALSEWYPDWREGWDFLGGVYGLDVQAITDKVWEP